MGLADDKYEEAKEALVENKTVRRPIKRLGSDMLPSKKAKKRKYTPVKVRNMVNKYFGWCEKHDEMPSVKGLILYIGLKRDSFYNYVKDPLYCEILENARMIIEHWAETDVYNTNGMAAGKIAYMKNVHQWSEKVQSQNYTEVKTITVDEARDKIAALAPRLLELLGNDTVVAQLAEPKPEPKEVNPRRVG